LRSGHQEKNCPKNNRFGINDCGGSHHFHLHFERRSKPPDHVDAAVETRSAFGDSEFEGDEARTLNETFQGLCIPDWNRHKVKWEHFKNIPFSEALGRKTIDILIGSDHPERLLALTESPITAPVAPRKTPLGWTCDGRLPTPPPITFSFLHWRHVCSLYRKTFLRS